MTFLKVIRDIFRQRSHFGNTGAIVTLRGDRNYVVWEIQYFNFYDSRFELHALHVEHVKLLASCFVKLVNKYLNCASQSFVVLDNFLFPPEYEYCQWGEEILWLLSIFSFESVQSAGRSLYMVIYRNTREFN